MRHGIFALILLFGTSVHAVSAGDWPHWRGADRNDIVSEASGFSGGKWPLGAPAWKVNVGIGCSSPIVVGKKLYATGWKQNREWLVCLDLSRGKVTWIKSYACPKYGRFSTGDKGIYAGPSSTPEYDAETGYLYTLSIDGDLNCWNTSQSGSRVWKRNLYDAFAVKRRPDVGTRRRTLRDYGYTSSPMVHGDQLLVEVGSAQGTVMAFDKRTGKRLWASECKDEAGHTGGPVPMVVEDVPCVAVLTLRHLVVMRLDKPHAGKTIAQYKWTTDFANNIPTPAVWKNSVVVTSAYNRYAMARLDISLAGAKKVWEARSPSGVCSPIIHRGHVYWAWRGVHCVDFATGKKLWTGGSVGTAGSCIITGDDRMIVWADNGNLLLVETARRSPKRYRELAKRNRIFRRDAWPHVVLANARLYCKDREGNLACFDLRPSR